MPIARVKPAVIGEYFCGEVGTLVIAEHDLGATDLNHTFLSCGEHVAVFIDDADFGASVDGADSAGHRMSFKSDSEHRRRFGETVAFKNEDAERVENLSTGGGRLSSGNTA